MAMLNNQMVQQIDLFEHVPIIYVAIFGCYHGKSDYLKVNSTISSKFDYCINPRVFPSILPFWGISHSWTHLLNTWNRCWVPRRPPWWSNWEGPWVQSSLSRFWWSTMEIVLDVFLGGTTHHCYNITSISWWIRSDVPICCWLKPHHSDDDPGSFFGLFLTHGVLLWAIGSFQPHAIGSSLGFWSHRKLDGSSHEQQTAANFDHWPSRVGPHLGLLYDFILRHHKMVKKCWFWMG